MVMKSTNAYKLHLCALVRKVS